MTTPVTASIVKRPPALLVERISDSVGAVRIDCVCGDADDCTYGAVFEHIVGCCVGVADRADGGFVDIGQLNREALR